MTLKVTLITAASCKTPKKTLHILIWLGGRAVKTQLQIVLIRLFVAPMDIQLVLKMNFYKNSLYQSIAANSLIS